MNLIFKGTATAMITPFKLNGEIDFDAFKSQIEYQITNGTDALVILGTTGEPATTSIDEDHEIINFAVNLINKRCKIIIGTGSNCTEDAIKYSQYAEKAGADALLVVTPYYNKCTQKGLIKYYNEICDSVNIPVIAYNVPGRTGVNILPQTMAEIAKHKNLFAVKEACGNMEQICDTARLIKGNAALYSGDDALTLPLLTIGSMGIISVVSNVIPKEVKELTTKFFNNDLTGARELHEKIFPLAKSMFIEVNPIPIKFAVGAIGLNGGYPRSPLTELEEDNKLKIISELKEFGFKI